MGTGPKRPEGTAAVILAAGRSTRMGAENKLLLEIEPGVTVIRRTVEHAIANGLAHPLVVTGHEADKIETALSGLGCRFVHNPAYADGLSGSIRTGFREAVSGGAEGVIVLLGDMPFLPSEAVEAVLAAAAENPDRIVQAVHAGKPAHPVWLPARIARLVEHLDGDRGVRGLAAEAGETMFKVEVGPDAVLDLDTPQDFAAALARRTVRDD